MKKKFIVILFLFTLLLLFNGCSEKKPEVIPITKVAMFENDTYYLGFGIHFKELTIESSVLQYAFINVPYEEVIIVDYTNEHKVDNWLSQDSYQMPLEIVEGNYYLIIFSSKDNKINDATELVLDFNDYRHVFEHDDFEK